MTDFTPPIAPPDYAALPMARRLPPPPFPTIAQAVALTALALVLQFVLGLYVWGLEMLTGLALTQPLGLGVANVLAFGAALGVGVYWGRLAWRQALPFRRMRALLLAPMAVTVLGLSVILSELSNVVLWLLPAPDFVNEIFQGLLGGEGGVWQTLILLTVIAPLTEEPLFRGLLLGGMLLRYRPLTAVVVTAMLFAIVHLNPWQFFPALGLGLLFGWWFLQTQSLWPCLFGHALNNAIPALAASIPGTEIPGYTTSSMDFVEFQPLWFNLAGLLVFSVGVVWTWIIFRRTPPRICAGHAGAPAASFSSVQP